jgi:hypothetical protein
MIPKISRFAKVGLWITLLIAIGVIIYSYNTDAKANLIIYSVVAGEAISAIVVFPTRDKEHTH